MSEEIVACPGCAKKFRIPEGAPPGSFACTACNADVPYGAPPAKAPAKQPVRPAPAVAKAPPAAARPAPAARPAAPAPAAPARPVAASAPARKAAPARRTARAAEPEEPQKSNQGLILGGIVVGGLALVSVAYVMTKPKPVEPPAPPPSLLPNPSKPAEAGKPEPPKPATPVAPTAPPKTEPAPAPALPEVPAGPTASTPETKPAEPKPAETKPAEAFKPKPRGDYAALGTTVASVPGTKEEERAEMDRQVALVLDMGSGRDGSRAEGALIGQGKKAIPSLLSSFSKQYTAGKWGTEAEQYGAFQVQQVLLRIVGQDGPNGIFVAQFTPGGLTPAEDFEKAAKMWIDWWNAKGQFKEKFKRSND